ncbi:MAG: hypothetical protein LCH57_14925 [Proteobacteria bacterium]|nr:hypothetical protein [Pseudomonadota bacterium]
MFQRGNRTLLTRRNALMAGAVAVLGGAGLSLKACDRAEAPVDEQGRVRLRFATDWRAQAEHGGYYDDRDQEKDQRDDPAHGVGPLWRELTLPDHFPDVSRLA